MNERSWRILNEILDIDASELERAMEKINPTLQPLRLPEEFSQRLKTTLREILVKYQSRFDNDAFINKITLRILSNFAKAGRESSWGFFIVEKGAEPNHAQIFELYLYQDEKEK
jgi:hypothetical protein